MEQECQRDIYEYLADDESENGLKYIQREREREWERVREWEWEWERERERKWKRGVFQ